MANKNKDLEKKHCQKLEDLFRGKLSFTEKSYYQNLRRLENYIFNFQEEVLENCINLSLFRTRAYFKLLIHKIQRTTISYDKEVLEHKLKKYGEKKSSFPYFSNEHLNNLLHTVPANVSVAGLTPEALTQHSLILKLQDAFFKYWLTIKKDELQHWLETALEEIAGTGEEVVTDRKSEIDTLNRKILFLEETRALPLLDTMFMENMSDILVDLLDRPKNKVQEKINELGKKPSERKPNSSWDKDRNSVMAYIARKRRDY